MPAAADGARVEAARRGGIGCGKAVRRPRRSLKETGLSGHARGKGASPGIR